MKATIHCYGNTRSGALTAATRLHLERLGIPEQDLQIGTGGLDKVVSAFVDRAGHRRLPEAWVANAGEVDPAYGQLLSAAERQVATPASLAGAQRVLVADENLGTEFGKIASDLPIQTLLQYAGHKSFPWGFDLDDSGHHGALVVVKARFDPEYRLDPDKDENERLIKEAIASGVVPAGKRSAAPDGSSFLYYAPLGGAHKISSPEGGKAEVQQLYTLGRLLACTLAQEKQASGLSL